jgi:mevalonate kinase
LLTELGVSSPELNDLVALALDAGALGAKLAGAGGGGVAFALVEDLSGVDRILAAAERAGVPALACRPAGVTS